MLRVIIFDMDDTLVVEQASAEAALWTTCRFAYQKGGVDPRLLFEGICDSCVLFWRRSPAWTYCHDIGISPLEGLWASFDGSDKNLRALSTWAAVYRRNSWQEALRRAGHDHNVEFSEELAQRYMQERRTLHVVYDDVIPVLERLKRYYRLGLLTNGTPDLQRCKLEASGLAGYFDTIVVSGEVGFGKPDRRVFKLILDRLQVTAASSAMIGNNLTVDIEPALSMGLMTVWVNRERKIYSDHIRPDMEVAVLTEVIETFCGERERETGAP